MIAVFDIGKTNKKLFVFDEDYNIVYETSAHLKETVDEDGDPCEDVHALTAWIRGTFNEVISDPRFDVRALNFSTYGASFVHLGDDGLPVAPLYNYLKPYPPDLLEQFYDTYGGKKLLSMATASPVLGNLNSGMQLYLIKHRKPDIFRRIRVSLHLPQYVSSLFTSSYCSDLTSIGCHTNLWAFAAGGDFRTESYHQWVHREAIYPKLAPIRHPDSPFEIRIGSTILYSGIGLHDSSAALIPYHIDFKERYILLSTGTWCITLNPFNKTPLTAGELDLDCLSYLSYKGNPVKASRLFSGHLHEVTCAGLAGHFNVAPDYYKNVAADGLWLQHKGRTSDEERSRIFAANDFSKFGSFEEAYTALVEHLINQQIISTNLVMTDEIKTIYVDGGFSQNNMFMTLLAEAFPNKKVFSATVSQAPALGAALVIHDSWNKKPINPNLLKLVPYHSNAGRP